MPNWSRFRRSCLVLVWILASGAAVAAEMSIYVYPPGYAGSIAQPSCNADSNQDCSSQLAEAVALLQTPAWQAKVAGMSTIRLKLAAGLYRVVEPLRLRWASQIPLDISGETGTVVSGAVPLTAWVKAPADAPKRLNRKYLASVLIVDVRDFQLPLQQIPQARGYGLPVRPVTTELFVGDAVQPVAAWPESGWANLDRPADLPASDTVTFALPTRIVSIWSDEPDLQAQAFWRWNWASQTYLVSQKDVATNRLVLMGAGSPYGVLSGQRIRIENALAELDKPGEWYLDRAGGLIYYYPKTAQPPADAEISVATGVLGIDGSRNVTVRNLRLEKTRGDAVTVSNSTNIVFDQVVIRNTGNRGLVLENCGNSGLRNSLIESNGEGGVYLSGGDRQTLAPGGNFVERSVIRKFARLSKTYRVAVEMQGVGQRVTDSQLYQGPHAAIFFNGNDHLIARNDIHDVVLESGDAGAIYIVRDFTTRGTVIEDNFVHDIQPRFTGGEVKGIYIDDQACGITVRRNIFARVQQPVFLSGGRDNVIEDNLFYYSTPAVYLDARGMEEQAALIRDPTGTWMQGLNAVPYQGPFYSARYPHLKNILDDDYGKPKYNVFRRNTVVGGQMSAVSVSAQSGISFILNRTAGQEIFAVAVPADGRIRRQDFALR